MSLAGVCGPSLAGMKRGRDFHPPRGSSAASMQFDCHLSHEFEPFKKMPCLSNLSPGPTVSLPVPVTVQAPPLLHHAMMSSRCSPPAAGASNYSTTGHIVTGHALHTVVPFGPGIQSSDALRMEDIELQSDQSKNGFTLFISDEPEEVSSVITSLNGFIARHHSFFPFLSLSFILSYNRITGLDMKVKGAEVQ